MSHDLCQLDSLSQYKCQTQGCTACYSTSIRHITAAQPVRSASYWAAQPLTVTVSGTGYTTGALRQVHSLSASVCSPMSDADRHIGLHSLSASDIGLHSLSASDIGLHSLSVTDIGLHSLSVSVCSPMSDADRLCSPMSDADRLCSPMSDTGRHIGLHSLSASDIGLHSLPVSDIGLHSLSVSDRAAQPVNVKHRAAQPVSHTGLSTACTCLQQQQQQW